MEYFKRFRKNHLVTKGSEIKLYAQILKLEEEEVFFTYHIYIPFLFSILLLISKIKYSVRGID